ncbi:hypothetical protein HBI21_029920 [Parastagonospora nodorum]|nr:hypothetical protein HBI21_029920 [Parastagonospora nodorum]
MPAVYHNITISIIPNGGCMASFRVSQQADIRILPQHFSPSPAGRALDTSPILLFVSHDSRDC